MPAALLFISYKNMGFIHNGPYIYAPLKKLVGHIAFVLISGSGTFFH